MEDKKNLREIARELIQDPKQMGIFIEKLGEELAKKSPKFKVQWARLSTEEKVLAITTMCRDLEKSQQLHSTTILPDENNKHINN